MHFKIRNEGKDGQVLAAPEGGRVNQSSGFEVGAAAISVNISAAGLDGARSGALVWRGRNTGPTANGHGLPFAVLSGEHFVDLRVLVDRSVRRKLPCVCIYPVK